MGGDKTYWATSSFDVVLVDLVHVYLKLFSINSLMVDQCEGPLLHSIFIYMMMNIISSLRVN